MDETALLLPVPAADPVIGEHRRLLDPAAADGIPAHITALYPFVPLAEIEERHHAAVERVCRETSSFHVHGEGIGWFGDRVLFVELSPLPEVHALIARFAEAFPAFPPYAGDIALADIVPHVTIGQARPVAELQAAARAIEPRLPWSQELDRVELWAGPAVAGRETPAPWTCIRSYPLGI